MRNFIFAVFVIVTISTSKARKCSPVVCPFYTYSMDESLHEISQRYFNQKLPQNGICPKGFRKSMIDGKFFGHPGETRCTCVPEEGPDNVGEFVAEPLLCVPGLQQCPKTVPYFKDEKLIDIYKRMGAMYIKKGITDGCCPKGFTKFFLDPVLTGVDKRLCYCDLPPDKIVVHEGSPVSLSSSDEY
jgi:hypothetical protein